MIENPHEEVVRVAARHPENQAALTLAQDLLALLNRADGLGVELWQDDMRTFVVQWHVADSVECIVAKRDEELHHWTITKAMGVMLRG